MANEVLGPRKTMFVLVIVVGCFAVLWPRILSPLIVGHTRDQLKPNQYDRDAGCCEVMFETEMAVLEILNEICSSTVQAHGKLTPYAAAECRKAVNETCGVDIAAYLKRSENVGKTSKMLLNTMKKSNSSCLKEHFGVPVLSFNTHQALNSWTLQDTVKQERSPIRGAGPHPALRERGRAIPPKAPTPTPSPAVPMPSHVRVRSSPLSVYFDLDIKPPPIPGMRPPLGSPGVPVPTPKSSMGFVMPIYTICIIVFFVYTLSKILFKRAGTVPYESIAPDPQFRRRVFRDDSRSSPDKLVVTAISGLVAEVRQQMEASYGQNQQRQDAQDNHTRPYTNGTILHNTGPVHIVASEYREASKEKSPEPQKEKAPSPEPKEPTPEPKESTPEPKESTPELKELSPEPKELSPEPKLIASELEEQTTAIEEAIQEQDTIQEPKELSSENLLYEAVIENEELQDDEETVEDIKELSSERELEEEEDEADIKQVKNITNDLIKLTENLETFDDEQNDILARTTEDFLKEESKITETDKNKDVKQSTPELLEEAIKEDSPEKSEELDGDEQENSSVKVIGMELTAHSADGGTWQPEPLPPATPQPPAPARPPHEAEEVKSIFLETEIPQKSRVLVAEFAEDRNDEPAPSRNSPMVVSGKMTLSLIQDAPRDTPERDPESTLDDFTTASAVTQPAAEKEDNLSDEEIDEEIEVEEIEEELEEEEDEEELEEETNKVQETKAGPERKK